MRHSPETGRRHSRRHAGQYPAAGVARQGAGALAGRPGGTGPGAHPAMIIVLRPDSTPEQIEHIEQRIRELGFRPHLSRGERRTIIGVIGDEEKLRAEPLAAIPGVEQVLPILKPFKLASREFRSADSVVQVGSVRIGGGSLAMIAGPCAVESEEILDTIARSVKAAG